MVKGTVYNGTKACTGAECRNTLSPIETAFGGTTGLCHKCKNKEQTKLRKNKMSKG